MRRVVYIVIAALALAVSCGREEDTVGDATLPYGSYWFAGQQVPVASVLLSEGPQLLLKVSPLEDCLSATTYAVIGVHTALLGTKVDVEYKFHNDDYIFVYEDPERYFSHLRPLKSGHIYLNRTAAGLVEVDVDVVLYDGTPFRYSHSSLCASFAE